jgi:hypothetical protein
MKLKDWKEREPPWFELLTPILFQAKGVHTLIQTLGMLHSSYILMSLCQLGDEWGEAKWKHIVESNNFVKKIAFVIMKLFHLFNVVLSHK